MPPKRGAGGEQVDVQGTSKRRRASSGLAEAEVESSDLFVASNDDPSAVTEEDEVTTARAPGSGADEEREAEKTIPTDLLTRLLHEFFAKDTTRISRNANAAVGKYVDVFVREAIARAALDKSGGFLEVEDLEKIAPQLLLDL